MSVLVNDRKESKIEVVIYPNEIHDMLIDLMQRSFGIKDLDHFVRMRYAHGKDDKEDFTKYRLLMHEFKVHINEKASALSSHVRIANSLYPTSLHEYEKRRDFQNLAICDCEDLKKELQRIVEIFNVDINLFAPHFKAIDREIGLIKKWRQRDNKIKSSLKG